MTGIIFEAEVGGVRIRVTRRADLAIGRIGRPSAPVVAVIEANGAELSNKLRRVLEQVFVAPGSAGLMTPAQVDDAVTRCRRMGFAVHTKEGVGRRKPVVARTREPVVEKRRVQDPSMSRAELLHQLERFPDARWVGFIRADTNMSELIGGMSRIRKRTETQTQAAAEFKNLSERAMLGAGGAIDYAAPRVDTSPGAGNVVADTGEDARRRLRNARFRLGTLTSIADRVIVGGETVSEVAEAFGKGKGGAARDRVTRMVLEAADLPAIEFGFIARGRHKQEGERWDDQSRQTFTSDGEKAAIKRPRAA